MPPTLARASLLALALSAFSLQLLPAQTSDAEYAREFKKSLSLAKKGNATAQVEVGIAYGSGRGAQKDVEKALDWYRKAAAQGSGSGMLQLGYLYEAGEVVEKNIETAATWFKKALDTKSASAAGHNLIRLSKAGLIKDTYVGIPVEGGLLTTRVDLSEPLEKVLDDLAAKPRTVETGKAYWIGYNPQMLRVGARGEAALPALVQFVRNATDPTVRSAGLLTIHLIGLECEVWGRNGEDFKNRKAREALWGLMKQEGLTDTVAGLLKRDPWPADVPAIMDALRTVESDCPATLNALLRYPLRKRTVDPEAISYGGGGVRFTKPNRYTDRDYVRLAIEGIRKSRGESKVTVEDGTLEGITDSSIYGNPGPTTWTGTTEELLLKIKDLDPTSFFAGRGRNLFYYTTLQAPHELPILHFCGAATAKKRWLEWWDQSGKDWYSASQ